MLPDTKAGDSQDIRSECRRGLNVEQQQVMAVRADGYGPGSGYLVAGRVLVTSAHAVGPVGSQVRVFRPGEEPVFKAVVAWRGSPGGRDDGALVAVDDDAWASTAVIAPARWGRTVTFRPRLACRTWGVPDAVQMPDAAVEVAQPSGTLSPGDGLVADRYIVDLDGAVPTLEGEEEGSPWGGLSGAAVFCGELLVGVVVGAVGGWGNRRLSVIPAYALHAADGFRQVLAEHQAAAVLEPAEFQDVIEPTVPVGAAGPVPSPAGLLMARRGVVPFHGRDDLLGRLETWARGTTGVGLWLVHGPSGQGKTRLARELSTRLAADWVIAWLRADAKPGDLAVLAQAARATLIVVDYAESRTAQLVTLLVAMAARHDGAPVRVLLLARTDNWWPDLAADAPSARDLLERAAVTALPVLDADEAARRAGYRAAAAGFAKALPTVAGQQGPDWARLASALAVPRLTSQVSVLGVHMNALADLLTAAGSGPATGPNAPGFTGARSVEDRLLEHEYGYWNTTAAAYALTPGLSRATLREAMAAAHLVDATSRQEADTLLARVPGLADQPYDRRRAARAWIAGLYPPASPGLPWDGLQPDRLAERFLGRHFAENPELADALAADADSTQGERMLTVYARAAAHPVFDHGLDAELTALITRHARILAPAAIEAATRVEHPRPLLSALQQITDDPATSLEELTRLAKHQPHYAAQILDDWAARITRRLVDEHRRLGPGDNEALLSDLAENLNNLSVRLTSRGRGEEKLAALSESVGIYRRLAAANPDVFLPRLGSSLNNYAGALAGLGRTREALAPTVESFQVFSGLNKAHPKNVQIAYGLAQSLHSLANRMGETGTLLEALEAIDGAVEIYRRLAELHPDVFLPDLAGGLHSHAVWLARFGATEEVVAVTSEEAEIYRHLAAVRPGAFLPDLAKSLDHVSLWLADLGRSEEALAPISESVEIYRRLAEARPGAFLPELAQTLLYLADTLAGVGRVQQALAPVSESVEIYQHLAEANPADHQAGLERSTAFLARLKSLPGGGQRFRLTAAPTTS